MSHSIRNPNAKFGTLPVFLTALSTILGAVLFLRFGWAVGQVGFWGVIGIVLLGHLVTIPTAMAVAEIATNQKVQGGGAYFIVSRSFGLNIGAAIGIALYFAQAISVAFYIIAFGEAFEPVVRWLSENTFLNYFDRRFITLPVMAALTVLMLTRGANVGMKALYWVVAILLTSLALFFAGKSEIAPESISFTTRILENENFFYVFAIVFPAFTGLAAGLGLSGDLKHPEKSIPKGTIWATIVGLVVYIFLAYKFTISATPDELVNDQFVMSKIAVWGPIIPIGLAAASISSALGSIIIAPRTLQAIGADDIFPNEKLNLWFSKGRLHDNEPINASIITVIIAFAFVAIGDVNFVAEIISMFFMITYGAICLISLLEHFAADPAYRPTFHSKWIISLIGTISSFWLMLKMNLPYAVLALFLMGIIYYFITNKKKEKTGLNKLFRGVIFQLSRELQIFAQRADREDREISWRPFAICISEDTFKRRSAFDIMRWLSHRYGFGTYIHFIKGRLNKITSDESKHSLDRLLKLAKGNKSRVYLDTIISPSYTSAIAQVVQLQGFSGRGNNLILFEFSRSKPDALEDVLQNYNMLGSSGFDICILNTSQKGFGYHNEIHIWIKPDDYRNANLMILLAFILIGHPDWKRGSIKIFSLTPLSEREKRYEKITSLIKEGRIPISSTNVEMIPFDPTQDRNEVIGLKSLDADLTLIGFNANTIQKGIDEFVGYKDFGNILFVSANKAKVIK
ncbi:MAG: amino acid permease [Prolixibacteraceae bacterium]|jgi:solute carrier family 12 sodium/potassium/chloride transporter 2|nr:amino acid permease [Prolixibacteraceae bacterium]